MAKSIHTVIQYASEDGMYNSITYMCNEINEHVGNRVITFIIRGNGSLKVKLTHGYMQFANIVKGYA